MIILKYVIEVLLILFFIAFTILISSVKINIVHFSFSKIHFKEFSHAELNSIFEIISNIQNKNYEEILKIMDFKIIFYFVLLSIIPIKVFVLTPNTLLKILNKSHKFLDKKTNDSSQYFKNKSKSKIKLNQKINNKIYTSIKQKKTDNTKNKNFTNNQSTIFKILSNINFKILKLNMNFGLSNASLCALFSCYITIFFYIFALAFGIEKNEIKVTPIYNKNFYFDFDIKLIIKFRIFLILKSIL